MITMCRLTYLLKSAKKRTNLNRELSKVYPINSKRNFSMTNKLIKSQEKLNHLIYMDDIKGFARNKKRIGDSNINNKNIQPGYRNEKQKNTNKGKNKTAKSRKNLGEKDIYKYLGILEEKKF